jgi:hypothetical protein
MHRLDHRSSLAAATVSTYCACWNRRPHPQRIPGQLAVGHASTAVKAVQSAMREHCTQHPWPDTCITKGNGVTEHTSPGASRRPAAGLDTRSLLLELLLDMTAPVTTSRAEPTCVCRFGRNGLPPIRLPAYSRTALANRLDLTLQSRSSHNTPSQGQNRCACAQDVDVIMCCAAMNALCLAVSGMQKTQGRCNRSPRNRHLRDRSVSGH